MSLTDTTLQEEVTAITELEEEEEEEVTTITEEILSEGAGHTHTEVSVLGC